ncbi:MAG: hypothetical protein HY880_02510, partial [Deltaproteobacteria bacterium]|nr:hypothetical protein [Deltaproteobacteria bacterium]
LFSPVPLTVTDDLHVSLLVVRQRKRFIFEPGAVAFIRMPSRDARHELERRRRIVSTRMRGVFIMRELLNPFRFGVYSFGLFVSKVVRSFLPAALIFLFLTSAHLAFYSTLIALFFLSQSLFYATALSYPLFLKKMKGRLFEKVGSIAYYFCVGNIGTFLGLMDWAQGRETAKWEPKKTDG